jgi:hypothetical protein
VYNLAKTIDIVDAGCEKGKTKNQKNNLRPAVEVLLFVVVVRGSLKTDQWFRTLNFLCLSAMDDNGQ